MLRTACPRHYVACLFNSNCLSKRPNRASSTVFWTFRPSKEIMLKENSRLVSMSSTSSKDEKMVTTEVASVSLGNEENEGIVNSSAIEQREKFEKLNRSETDKGLADFQNVENLEKLTVVELRTILRNLGINPSGRKQDLIKALKDHSKEKSRDDACIQHNSENSGGNKTFDIGQMATTKGQKVMSNVSVQKRKYGETRKGKSKNKQVVNYEEVDVDADSDKNVTTKKMKVGKIKSADASVTLSTVEDMSTLNSEQPWAKLVHKKPQPQWIVYNPSIDRPKFMSNDKGALRLISWNVNGLRALLKRKENFFAQLSKRENFDILCLQETKLQEKDVEQIKRNLLDGYDHSFWSCSMSKLGYSGTAVISRIKPVSVSFGLGITDHDNEGRLITIELENVFIVGGYIPNAGQKLERLTYRVKQWDPSLSSYIKALEIKKPVILTGDLNCAHGEIDIYNPDGNRKSAGFTDEERLSFEDNFLKKGFVDTFRQKYPNSVGYTYWGYRQNARRGNRGWRLDYFLVSDSIAENVHDSYTIPDIDGSDHCPIGLVLKH